MAIHAVTDDNFETEVLQADGPVLVDFWAEWCPPCKALMPIVEDFANDSDGKVKVVKVNIDENPEAPSKYNVRSIPTLIVFQNGEMKEAKVGAGMYKSQIEEWVESVTEA